uniref:G-protein coupled receptors family 1 profile domain-containing protein n=1 Tax=Globodera rostochiensis TaxID=31243 RepID=A0A914ICE7_GLORO
MGVDYFLETNCIQQTMNSSSSCNTTKIFINIQNWVELSMVCGSFIAISMNLLIIFCAFRIFSHRNRDTIHVYIISMTMGDLILVVCQFLESLNRLTPFQFISISYYACFLVNFVSWVGWAASGMSLVLLNSDKLLFFCFPLYYRLVKSVRRAITLSLAIWLISFCFVSYVWSERIIGLIKIDVSATTTKYGFNIYNPVYYSLFVMLSCVLPISSSLLVSCYLLRLMHSKRNQQLRTDSIQSNSSAQRPVKNANFVPLAPAFSHKLRSLIFIFTTTVWTAISLLPFRILIIVRLNFFDAISLLSNCELLTFMVTAAWILHYILMLSPVVNPFITAIIYHPYRVTFVKQLSFSGSSIRSTQL